MADERLVIDPDVLPPEDEDQGRYNPLWVRLQEAFGPIAAGVLIDGLDVATFGRFGIMAGPLIGGSAAYWVSSIYRLPVWQRLIWAVLAGTYCMVPRTEFIPVATLLGAFARFWHSKRRR